MKKLLSLILVTVLCVLALASCDTIKGLFGGDDTNEPQDNITYDLPAAVDYVRTMYIKDLVETPNDYEVVAQVMVAGVKYIVDWSVDNDKVKLTKGETTWTVDVDNKAAEAHDYVLTATVIAGDGTKDTVSFNHTVPKYNINSFEEYMAAKEGDTLTVEGIVVAINSKAAGNKRNHLFLMDATGVGGYYSYQMDADPVKDLGIQVGMTVAVTGPAAPYSGMMEIKGGVATIVDSTIKTITPIDITDKFVSSTDFNQLVALPVVIKGVTIGTQDLATETSQYLYFELNGVQSYVRTYVTDFPTTLTEADKTTIDTLHASKQGYVADVTGIMITYSGNPYIIPTSVDCFYNINLPERSDADKVALELGAIEIPADITKDAEIQLPLAGVTYPDVKFAWTVDNTAYTIGEDGKVVIKLGADKATLKFTVTATLGANTTVTKEYTVNVAAGFVMSETHGYVPYIYQGKTSKKLYLDGGVSGRYLTTTEDATKAVKVYAEKVEGGYKLYILVEGEKQYITIYANSENKDSVKYDAAGNTVFNYNAVVNAFATNFNGTDKYLGTYNEFATISVSNLSYITAENTGVSQFPLELLPVADGAELLGSLVQAKLENKVLYLDGGVSGRYLTTTEDVTKAVRLFAEKVEGGFKFYILVEDAKQYVTLYNNEESKLSVKYDAEGNFVFNYNALVNAWVTVFDGTEYYLGTYNTFNTVSASKLSYINAENTGVEQFPLVYNVIEGHIHSFSEATCTEPAKCECGETQGEALGHTWNDATCTAPKTCSVCNTTEGEAKGHDYGEDGVCANGCGISKEHVCEFDAATCTTPKTCPVCNTTDGEALGHDYQGATCTVKGICSRCQAEGDVLPHIDDNADYKCDRNCGANVLPAADTTITLAQAQKIAALFAHNTYTADKYYVVVTINEVYNTQYGNLYVKDSTVEKFTVYGTYSADGSTKYDAMAIKPVAGDTVTLYGIIGTFSNAAQMKNAWITEHTAHTCVPGAAATCTTAQTCTICSKVIVEALGHDFQGATCDVKGVCSVCQAEGAALGHIDEDANKVCDRCQAAMGDAPVEKDPVTVTLSYPKSSSTTNMGEGNNAASVGLDANIFTVTSTKNGCQQHIGLNKSGYLAVYSVRASGAGNTLTVSAAAGYKITTVKVTYKENASYATFTVNGEVVVGEDGSYTVNGTSFSIQNTFKDASASKNLQVHITSIEISYVEA